LVKAKGPISIVSQSGTIAAALACWAEGEGIGISKLIALGNKCDVDETELLAYLGEDKDTEVIALYIEGVREGRKFLEAAKAAIARKPVVVVKGGRTEKGAEAVLSHTKSLAGSDAVFDAAFKQAGIIRALDVEELYDICKGFACLPPPKGKNVAIVTSSGGSGILATDACEERGLNVIDLPAEVRDTLKDKLPPECILRNPLDLTGSATSRMYDEALTALEIAPDINSIIVVVGDPIPGIAEVIAKHFNRGKTLMPVMLGGGEVEVEERKKLQHLRVAVYPNPVRAVRTLAAMAMT
jgi:acyl-CoA synthetase (NDP forming)